MGAGVFFLEEHYSVGSKSSKWNVNRYGIGVDGVSYLRTSANSIYARTSLNTAHDDMIITHVEHTIGSEVYSRYKRYTYL